MTRPATLKALTLSLALGALTLSGCHRDHDDGDEHGHHQDRKISAADAAKVTDATVATWQSMDAAKIDALYSPDVVGFDMVAGPLSTDRANWTKFQQAFAGAKFDKATVTQSNTQILDDEDFIFSSVATLTSSAGPTKSSTARCTDVFRRRDDDKFLIVNEHCSAMPPAAKSA